MSITVRASESSHWYTREGAPKYTVEAKNGNLRNTTLADARKLNLVPSVTTIIGCAAKPGLEAWKLNQMLLAALTLPRADGETEDSYVQRIVRDSKEHAKAAANRGTEIHGALEQWYLGVMHFSMAEYQMGVGEAVLQAFGMREWLPEKSFAHELGFGGKIDLYTADNDGVVIDFKTKEFSKGDKIDGFDEQCMQLAAYRKGLNLPNARCANVFVSVTQPGLAVVKEWTQDELNRGWEMFNALRTFWFAKSGLQLTSN
jgi:hypothetical protein